MTDYRWTAAWLVGGLLLMPVVASAQNVTNPPGAAATPTAPPPQPVAPHAGAAGNADAATSAPPTAGRTAPGSDNGGQLAGPAVPGGRNHAPAEGTKPGSFSAPIDKN